MKLNSDKIFKKYPQLGSFPDNFGRTQTEDLERLLDHRKSYNTTTTK